MHRMLIESLTRVIGCRCYKPSDFWTDFLLQVSRWQVWLLAFQTLGVVYGDLESAAQCCIYIAAVGMSCVDPRRAATADCK